MSDVKTERQWSYDMYKKLMDEYPTKGDALAEEFGISVTNLRDRAMQLGVSLHQEFTEEEDLLFKKYQPKLKEAMVFLMPYRSPSEISLHK